MNQLNTLRQNAHKKILVIATLLILPLTLVVIILLNKPGFFKPFNKAVLTHKQTINLKGKLDKSCRPVPLIPPMEFSEFIAKHKDQITVLYELQLTATKQGIYTLGVLFNQNTDPLPMAKLKLSNSKLTIKFKDGLTIFPQPANLVLYADDQECRTVANAVVHWNLTYAFINLKQWPNFNIWFAGFTPGQPPQYVQFYSPFTNIATFKPNQIVSFSPNKNYSIILRGQKIPLSGEPFTNTYIRFPNITPKDLVAKLILNSLPSHTPQPTHTTTPTPLPTSTPASLLSKMLIAFNQRVIPSHIDCVPNQPVYIRAEDGGDFLAAVAVKIAPTTYKLTCPEAPLTLKLNKSKQTTLIPHQNFKCQSFKIQVQDTVKNPLMYIGATDNHSYSFYTAVLQNGNVPCLPVSANTKSLFIAARNMLPVKIDAQQMPKEITLLPGNFEVTSTPSAITGADYAVFLKSYLTRSKAADLDNSGSVWVRDYAIMLKNLGKKLQE